MASRVVCRTWHLKKIVRRNLVIRRPIFLPLVVEDVFLEGNGTGMRNWLVHAFVKKNISPSPLKLPIHERECMNTGEVDPTKLSEEGRKRAASIPAFQRSLYILRKSLVIRRPFFTSKSRGGYFFGRHFKGKDCRRIYGKLIKFL